jgi:hypothetical protein
LPAENNATENRGVGFKPTSSGISIKDMLAAKAAAHNLPPELLHKIAGVESGYKANAANSRSSAKGLFQFTDSTWKGMGGKEGEQFDPEKNAELGARFVRQNAVGLKGALGRNPTYGEVYASHFFGLKGAKDLLNMNPKTPMDQAVSSQVLKANPQLQGKTVGQVMASLNAKTGEGIVALADGGIAAVAPYYGYAAGGAVKHFLTGDVVQDSFGRAAGPDIRTSQIIDDFGNVVEKGSKPKPAMSPFERLKAMKMGDISKGIKAAAVPAAVYEGGKYLTNASANTLRASPAMQEAYGSDYGDPGSDISIAAGAMRNADPTKKDLSSLGLEYYGSNSPAATAKKEAEDKKTSVKSTSPTDQDFKDFDQASALFQAEQANKGSTEIKAEAPKNEFDEFLADIKSRRAGQAKQKSIDSYMALLQAGLGMMSGTSPHALANIGQGAMSGIQSLSEANKLRAAEQANLDKSQYAALRYKQLGEISQNTANLTEAQRNAALQERIRANNLSSVKAMKDDARSMAIAGLKQQGMLGMDLENPDSIAKIEEATRAILAREPAYAQAYKAAHGVEFNGGAYNFTPQQVSLLNKYK